MKLDFKKSLAGYKAKHNEFELLDIPEMQYLMVDGHGTPHSKDYVSAIETLYPVAYALKFMSKQKGKDYVVPPLEGLWWAEDMSAYTEDRKDEWDWTMMIMTPDWISQSMFSEAVELVKSKKAPSSINKLRLQTLNEGLCVQLLHIGSYSDEAPILRKLHHEFIPENNLKMTGKHHEIYISDPRKVAPEKLKTILRQPVENIGH